MCKQSGLESMTAKSYDVFKLGIIGHQPSIAARCKMSEEEREIVIEAVQHKAEEYDEEETKRQQQLLWKTASRLRDGVMMFRKGMTQLEARACHGGNEDEAYAYITCLFCRELFTGAAGILNALSWDRIWQACLNPPTVTITCTPEASQDGS